MKRRSAGLLPYRSRDGVLELFLVHPGGPFWARRDLGAWSVPKGEVEEGEAGLAAAVREFREETGLELGDGAGFVPLATVRQPGGKVVHAWAVQADLDAAAVRSNRFEMEWPPGSGRIQSFPEVDRAAWFTFPVARQKVLAGQRPLLEQVSALLPPGSVGG